jgi:hypothetical protein
MARFWPFEIDVAPDRAEDALAIYAPAWLIHRISELPA